VHDARHDGLTGLPNRTRIFEALEDAIVRNRPGSHVAAMFVDLDGLKQLNDTLGRP
jgi:diguanylate cyclase (GGDEF)-like protein